MNNTFLKDPDATLDYSVDWEPWLAGDTLSSSVWFVPEGVTEESKSHSDNVTTVWLSGGAENRRYTLTNRITTSGGRSDDRTFTLYVRER